MNRVDTSDYLVHFTKGEHALDNFASIVKDAQLLGGTGYIKGNYRCVCFSEAPLHAIQDILMHSADRRFKYSPFGVIVTKQWLFAQGGRPVIYQRDDEFINLPEPMRWKHVRYEPDLAYPVDFTWEREWRVPCDSLTIAPENAWLVLPSVDDLRAVCQSHTFAKEIPESLYDRLEDFACMDACVGDRCWTAILLANPSEGWSGIDVDLD